MAFSLTTGEWIRTIPTPTGDGPAELTEGLRSLAVARGGGVYASGLVRVIEFDALGQFVRSWTPEAPTRDAVCDFSGAPAVPTQGGVVRRGFDGDENIGPVLAKGSVIDAPTIEAGVAITMRLVSSRIACAEDEDVAYVVSSYDAGPDTVVRLPSWCRRGPDNAADRLHRESGLRAGVAAGRTDSHETVPHVEPKPAGVV